MSKLKEISFENFLNSSLTEENLEREYSEEYIESKYKKYKKDLKTGNITLQIYVDNHMEKRFEERYVKGDIPVGIGNSIGSKILFKDLPNWRSLERKDFDKVLLNGINKLIKDHKLKFGAYFIVSESTRLVIPIIIAKLKGQENHKLCIINTVLHTGMSNIDNFRLGKTTFNDETVYVERKIQEFFYDLLEEYNGSLGILTEENLIDKEFNIQLEYIIEGKYNVNTNYPLVVVK